MAANKLDNWVSLGKHITQESYDRFLVAQDEYYSNLSCGQHRFTFNCADCYENYKRQKEQPPMTNELCVRCKLDKALSYAHGLCWFCYWNFKPIPRKRGK